MNPCLATLLIASPAWANNGPSGQTVLAEILVLPVMMLFTALGGGYALLRIAEPKRRPVLQGLAAILLVLCSGAQGGIAVLVTFLFALVSFYRTGQMLRWAWRKRRGTAEDPIPGAGGGPARLAVAAVANALVTAWFVGLAICFAAWWPWEGQALRTATEIAAYEVAVARSAPDARFEVPSEAEPHRVRFKNGEFSVYGHQHGIIVTIAPDGRSFVVDIVPEGIPPFPYRFVASLPSYRADETGVVRAIRTRENGARCPADAPEAARVGDAEVLQWTARFQAEAGVVP